MITKNIGNLIEISSESGYIHEIGTNNYFKKGIAINNISNYEEVFQLPSYTRDEYVKKVRELIKEKYTIEDEIALHRLREVKTEEFNEYNSFCENCKTRAKEILNG